MGGVPRQHDFVGVVKPALFLFAPGTKHRILSFFSRKLYLYLDHIPLLAQL